MKKDRAFYQSKFEHYRTMNLWVAVACCISSLFYVISDWYLFGEVNGITVPARMAILVPFTIFLIVNAKVKDYRIMVPMSFLVAHSIMWGTIWACAYLPDLTFASDGFIIIMSVFIFFGFAAPWHWAAIFTALIFADIAIANTFLHYPEFMMMLILGIPFYFGIAVLIWAVERSYVLQYQAQQMLEESAFHDQLTGIYNRNIMNTLIDEQKAFTCFKRKRKGILLFDIDYFKKVNDTYGHEGGDIVLKEVVRLAQSRVDVPYYMVRWGGEEFLFILDESVEDTIARAEEIRKAVEGETHEVCPVTISIGVTEYTGGDYNQTVQRADQAMYRAKKEGRNRVCVQR